MVCTKFHTKPAELRKAFLRTLLEQAREARSQQLFEAAEAPADTHVALSVAFLAPPSREKEVVQEMLETEELKDFIDQGDFNVQNVSPMSDDDPDVEPSSLPEGAMVASGPSRTEASVPASVAWLGSGDPEVRTSSPEPTDESSSEAESSSAPVAESSLAGSADTRAPRTCDATHKPWMVYNADGLPCAHWERKQPPLAKNLQDFDRLGYACGTEREPYELKHLLEWLRDFNCTDNLLSPTEETLTWESDNPEASQLVNQAHEVGHWYRFGFRKPVPEPFDGIAWSHREKWKHKWADYQRCIHSTNLYVLPKLLREGLMPGENPGKGGKCGVYCYRTSRATLGVKSSGYCVYVPPHEDGWFVGPRIEMQVALGKAHEGNIAVGAHQYCAWLGCYSATALWVHVIHEDDIRAAFSDQLALFYTVDKWRPEFVVPSAKV